MNFVIDGANQWPITSFQNNPTTIVVTMAGNNGLNAVCSGPARAGAVVYNNNQYPVRLPGAFQGMVVTFKKA